MDTITTASIDTTLGIGMHTVWDERSYVGKSLAVLKGTILVHVERVNGGGGGKVTAVEAKSDASVGDIDTLSIRSKTNTVGKSKVISDNSYGTGVKVVSIYLVSQTRNRAEVLKITVESVGEVQVTIPGVDANVVQGVELAAEVVVKEG
jgi:hypothetical protein